MLFVLCQANLSRSLLCPWKMRNCSWNFLRSLCLRVILTIPVSFTKMSILAPVPNRIMYPYWGARINCRQETGQIWGLPERGTSVSSISGSLNILTFVSVEQCELLSYSYLRARSKIRINVWLSYELAGNVCLHAACLSDALDPKLSS